MMNEFLKFRLDMCPVEGDYGPKPVIPPYLEAWYKAAFPGGDPVARNVLDARTKKEGKSADAAAVALYFATRAPYGEVVIAAADKDQAKDRVFRSARFAIENGPLAKHAKVWKDTIEFDNKSIVQALPMDWKGSAGGNYRCVIFDELHGYTHEGNRRMFDELIVPPTVQHGVRWIASYAGWLNESELLHEWWNHGLAGERIHEEYPFYLNSDLSLLAFIDKGPESWRMPWITEEYVSQVRLSERPNSFRRLWLNDWVSNESQFVPREAWDACKDPAVRPLTSTDPRRLILGADASTARDLTALVGCVIDKESNTVHVPMVEVWKPKKMRLRGGKPTVDLERTIDARVRELHSRNQIQAIVADAYQLHSLMIGWRRLGITVIEMPQTNKRTEADQALYDAIIAQTVRHYGDPALSQHVYNAVAVESQRGFRLDKAKTSLKIDAAVALSMAHFEAQARMGGIDMLEYLQEEGYGVDGGRPPVDEDPDPEYDPTGTRSVGVTHLKPTPPKPKRDASSDQEGEARIERGPFGSRIVGGTLDERLALEYALKIDGGIHDD